MIQEDLPGLDDDEGLALEQPDPVTPPLQTLPPRGTIVGGREGESPGLLASNLRITVSVTEWDADAKKWRSYWSTSTYASRSFAVLRALLESASKLAVHLNHKGRL